MELRDLYAWLIKFRPEHKQNELMYISEKVEQVKQQRVDRPIEKIYKHKIGKH